MSRLHSLQNNLVGINTDFWASLYTKHAWFQQSILLWTCSTSSRTTLLLNNYVRLLDVRSCWVAVSHVSCVFIFISYNIWHWLQTDLGKHQTWFWSWKIINIVFVLFCKIQNNFANTFSAGLLKSAFTSCTREVWVTD